MTVFVAKRLVWGVVVILAVVTLTFVATVLSPVDPVEVYAGRFATPEVKAEITEEFGLDRPPAVRYFLYLKELARGNLGVSIATGQPVVDTLADRLPATIKLAIGGILIQILIGVPLGIIAAMRPGSLVDRFVLLFTLAGALAPVFVVGFLLLYLIAFKAALLPIGGYGGIEHLILPALTIGLAGAPWIARMMRSTMLEIRNAEFVRAARARGAPKRSLLLRHMLPNAIGPIITMVAIDAGVLLTSALVVEQVYAWPGIGQQAWLAVSQNDFPMIMGVVIITATAIVVFNLLADVTNMVLDPRIRRR